jgi:hypothetical protein
MSKEFMEFCDKVKIQCQYTIAITLQQNDVAIEMMNIILMYKNKSTMLKSNTPNHLWAKAFNTTY